MIKITTTYKDGLVAKISVKGHTDDSVCNGLSAIVQTSAAILKRLHEMEKVDINMTNTKGLFVYVFNPKGQTKIIAEWLLHLDLMLRIYAGRWKRFIVYKGRKL
jgi:uncharacterized protein YsxB (DUF464 family)